MPWKPSESGNLLGRPPIGRSLAECVRRHVPPERIVKKALELMESEDERVQMVALQFLAERGYGKPPPGVDGSGELTHEHASLVHVLGSTPHQRRLAEADETAEVVDAVDP
jgi:hypothetical protein